MTDETHVGNVGIPLKLTVESNGEAKDISTATSKQILLKKPGGELATLDGYFFNGTGTDGVLAYDSVAATFNRPGLYRAQAFVTLASGIVFYSSIYDFNVYGNLEA